MLALLLVAACSAPSTTNVGNATSGTAIAGTRATTASTPGSTSGQVGRDRAVAALLGVWEGSFAGLGPMAPDRTTLALNADGSFVQKMAFSTGAPSTGGGPLSSYTCTGHFVVAVDVADAARVTHMGFRQDAGTSMPETTFCQKTFAAYRATAGDRSLKLESSKTGPAAPGPAGPAAAATAVTATFERAPVDAPRPTSEQVQAIVPALSEVTPCSAFAAASTADRETAMQEISAKDFAYAVDANAVYAQCGQHPERLVWDAIPPPANAPPIETPSGSSSVDACALLTVADVNAALGIPQASAAPGVHDKVMYAADATLNMGDACEFGQEGNPTGRVGTAIGICPDDQGQETAAMVRKAWTDFVSAPSTKEQAVTFHTDPSIEEITGLGDRALLVDGISPLTGRNALLIETGSTCVVITSYAGDLPGLGSVALARLAALRR